MATTEEIKAALSQKIDSREKWNALIEPWGWGVDIQRRNIPGLDALNDYENLSGSMSGWGNPRYARDNEGFWWLARETMREKYEVYPTPPGLLTNVIACFRLAQYAPHVSVDDPMMVALTMSTEDGIRDRQVKMSFGKMLRKFCILLTDNEVQRLEAMFRAGQDPRFDVATDIADIIDVYTGMSGDSGCMRYDHEHFGMESDQHPSMVYAAPGMGVAYVKVDGEIKSRAVIWTNPEDPADKRFVRVYGDSALRRKLEMAGYRQNHLAGARLALHYLEDRDEDDEDEGSTGQIALPYLDGPGGEQGTRDGSYVMLVEGEDTLRVLYHDQVVRAQRAGLPIYHAKSTSGKTHVRPIPLAELVTTCPITGAAYDLLKDDVTFDWVYHEGRAVKANTGDPRVREMFPSMANDYVEGQWSWRVVRISRDTPTFYSGGTRIESPANRRALGYVKLAEGYGYDTSAWVKQEGLVNIAQLDDEPRYVPSADVYTVRSADNEITLVHKEDAAALKKSKLYVSLVPRSGRKMLCHKDNPRLVITVSGRKAHHDVHELTTLRDGRVEFTKLVQSTAVLGQRFVYLQGENPLDQATAERFAETWEKWFNARRFHNQQDVIETGRRHLAHHLRDGVRGYAVYSREGQLFRTDWSSGGVPLDQYREGVAQIERSTDAELIERFHEGALPFVRDFARIARLMLTAYDQAEQADAQARHPQPVPVPEPAPVAVPRGALSTEDQLIRELTEGMTTAQVAEVTGLAPGIVAMAMRTPDEVFARAA